MSREVISKAIKGHQETIEQLLKDKTPDIQFIADKIIESLKNGGKLMVFGNGGSAADSQHMAAEFTGRFLKEREPLAAIALTTNTPGLTAIANDYGYEVIFSKQIEALGNKKDIALAISTSGNSENIIKAVEIAKKMGIFSIGLAGKDGGKLSKNADFTLVVSSKQVPRIQEAHSLIIHIICELVENSFC